MSATNTTPHYELPSFLATDKPAWLVDWNGAMAKIDAGIYQAQQSADQSGTDISALQNSLATLSGTVDSQGLTISTLSQSLTTAIGNINTINSLIGNGTPTTTDQTIIGAINEINARTGDADGISYDNTDSGLNATNVQGAIDENAEAINDINSASYFDYTTETPVWQDSGTATAYTHTITSNGMYNIRFQTNTATAGSALSVLVNNIIVSSVRTDVQYNTVRCQLKLKNGAVLKFDNPGGTNVTAVIQRLS